ncbi:hypothetical protein ACH5RR_024741 [Cinchona calisaya]|uniref:Late embryogenesis abundant protein n=1 Tax=Cinchona calisaya TaxID=153742 RepID=A0ABD2YXM7_9GENT
MATSAGRGAQTVNSMYFKPMLRKAFHRKSNSPDVVSDTAKLNGEEMKNKSVVANQNHHHGNWWVADDRTGIFYPKGQEKVMENVPSGAAKDSEPINWFSNNDL